jgi:hypothetical protein
MTFCFYQGGGYAERLDVQGRKGRNELSVFSFTKKSSHLHFAEIVSYEPL